MGRRNKKNFKRKPQDEKEPVNCHINHRKMMFGGIIGIAGNMETFSTTPIIKYTLEVIVESSCL